MATTVMQDMIQDARRRRGLSAFGADGATYASRRGEYAAMGIVSAGVMYGAPVCAGYYGYKKSGGSIPVAGLAGFGGFCAIGLALFTFGVPAMFGVGAVSVALAYSAYQGK